jgi:Xaa-Pro aminopeptidase
MVNRGVEEAFSTIVATGPNTALPHAIPGPRKSRSGEFLLIDMGVKANFYHSDMTRTVAVGSKNALDAQDREIYEIVREAQAHAIAKIKPGVKCADVDREARSFITNAGYGDAFGHGLGHGVGLDIHEGPTLSPRSTEILREGMVVSVEPGIYLPGKAGVRIEDLVVLTRDGCENLNKLSKALKYIE